MFEIRTGLICQSFLELIEIIMAQNVSFHLYGIGVIIGHKGSYGGKIGILGFASSLMLVYSVDTLAPGGYSV